MQHQVTLQFFVGEQVYVVSSLRNADKLTWKAFGPCLVEEIKLQITLDKDKTIPRLEERYYVRGFVLGFSPSHVYSDLEKAKGWAEVLNSSTVTAVPLKGGE